MHVQSRNDRNDDEICWKKYFHYRFKLNLFHLISREKRKSAICILFQIETRSAKVGMWAEVQSVFIEYVD